jgi:hypothetical protein
MPYSIDRYSGQTVAVVEDGTINNTLDIKLIGKNYAGYGEAQNENLVWLLENFSNSTPPARPITGQLWYDSGTRRLKFYDGVNFKDTSRTEVDDERPVGVNTGDFWYNTRRKQLFVFDGDDYRLVGPQDLDGTNGSTTMVSLELNDDNLNKHPVVVSVINGEPMSIFSSASFIVDTVTPIVDRDLYSNVITADRLVVSDFITRFPKIKEGITLRRDNPGFDDGVSAPDPLVNNPIVWGTASDAQRLGGILADNYVRKNAANTRFNTIARFDDIGFTVGDAPDNDLKVFIEDGTIPTIMNQTGNSIVFKTTDSGIRVPLTLIGQNVLPGVDNVSDIGSSTLRYRNIHANEFRGLGTHSQRLFATGITANDGFGVGYVEGAVPTVPNTIVARDIDGNINANRLFGIATSALNLVSGSTIFTPGSFVRYEDPDFQANSPATPVSVVLNTSPLGGIDFGSRTTPSFSIKVASSALEFRTGNGVNQRTPLILSGANILPGTTGTSNIGSGTFRYGTMFAGTFDGMATSLQVNNSTARFATTANTPSTVVARDENSVIRATTFEGTATRVNVAGNSQEVSTANTANSVVARDANSVVRATTFEGTATRIVVDGESRIATNTNTINTVAARDASGVIRATTFEGTATRLSVEGESRLATITPTASTIAARNSDGNIFAVRFIGIADDANRVRVNSGGYYNAIIEIPGTSDKTSVVARSADGDIFARHFEGIAAKARYADLAEKYLADADYPVGTVVCIGGEKEVTACQVGDLAIGTVSENPAYMMNSELEGGTYIALKGRVPVRVIGEVKKGDRLISAPNGTAIALKWSSDIRADANLVFAVALESNNKTEEKLVEAIVL